MSNPNELGPMTAPVIEVRQTDNGVVVAPRRYELDHLSIGNVAVFNSADDFAAWARLWFVTNLKAERFGGEHARRDER